MSQPIALKKHDRCAFCGKSDATYQQVVEAAKALLRLESPETWTALKHALAAVHQGEAHA